MDLKPEKPDRRIQRTRQLLRDALMGMILERGYDSITVQDITDRANLGRATFYLHYRDKEELLVKSLEDIYDGLVKRIEVAPYQRIGIAPQDGKPIPSLIAFEHAAQNQDLYRVLLNGRGAGSVRQRILDYLVGVVKRHIEAQWPDGVPVSTDLLAHHVAGSLLTLISWWVENDMPYPAEEMARITQMLNAEAITTLMKGYITKTDSKIEG